jgi:prephenate dehydrogenase
MQANQTITIIGLGLMGGSFALQAKQKNLCSHIIGVENNEQHAQQALQLGLANQVLPLIEAVQKADIVLITTPVQIAKQLLPIILNNITNQVVFDMGSTKQEIIEAVKDHPKRKQFVATHPMWGTEHSGPQAATIQSFAGRVTVICNKEESSSEALGIIENLYKQLGMQIINMPAVEHDLHAAYVSHISHITSFALALTVLEKEKEEDAIFALAGGGFESTVRLAKSNPDMWVPIFAQNRSYVLDVLNEHIHQLKQIKKLIEMQAFDTLHTLLKQANEIKRILPN